MHTGHINGVIHVHPDYRGRGVGRGFANFMETVATRLGMREIDLGSPNFDFWVGHLGYSRNGEYAHKRLE